MTIWHKLEFFSKNEKNIYGKPAWGEPDKICPFTLETLDEITRRVKKEIWEKYNRIAYCLVHCTYEERDSGYHPLGTAIDFHFAPRNLITPYMAYDIINNTLIEYNKSNFMGLGVYPNWANPGFHLDTRLPNDPVPDRWSRVNNIYTDIDEGLKILKGV